MGQLGGGINGSRNLRPNAVVIGIMSPVISGKPSDVFVPESKVSSSIGDASE